MSLNDTQSLALREEGRSVSFLALRIDQPVGEFYSAVIPAKKLIEIAYFDIRGLTQHENFAEFMGIQRELDASRVAELRRYVRSADPSFPTGIVLAVDDRCAIIEEIQPNIEGLPNRLVKMTLKNYNEPEAGLDPILYRDIARVIDGQHRIAGLIGYESPPEFELNVAIFVGADIATQASIFSTVNQAQTKVNRSLVYDLFSYQKTRSPEKTCHDIAVILDREENSPFYKKIKRLGVATEGRFGETLSQATFVKGLIQYISRDVLADRDAAKRGRPFPKAEPKYEVLLFLRPYFVDNDDDVVADLIWNYFDAVRAKWPEAWRQTGQGWVLNKTAGYAGLMRFLRPCFEHLNGSKRNVPRKQDFDIVFQNMKIEDDAFRSSNIRPGTSGERYVFDMLVSHAGI